jgi:excisionase family DNA binding protein
MTALDHITSGEACRILGVNPTTLAKWARDGTIPSIKLPGRNGAFVYMRGDVEILAAARAAAQQENVS